MIGPVVLAVLLILAVALLGGLAFAGITYLENREVRAFKPCCPPGLGCNDPDAHRRHCHRALALRLADVEDGPMLDRAWSQFVALNLLHPRQRTRALVTYGKQRDRIIERRMQEMSAAMQDDAQRLGTPGAPQLPRHSEVMQFVNDDRDFRPNTRSVRGEILDADEDYYR